MKKFLLITNIILILAVAYLYYEHYKYIDADIHGKEIDKAAVQNSFKIAYFELDSLENNYDYYKEVKDYLTKKDQNNTEQLNAIRNKYQTKLKEYQQKGSTLSQNEQSDYEQQLMQLQSDYQQTEQSLSNDFNAETAEKLQGVKNKIQDFLKGYCAAKGLAYVFATSESDFIYYKDTVRNITPDVIQGLNEAYQKEKNKK